MKNLLFGGFLALFFLLTIPACDPCNDCGPSSFEPEVSATFFNGDSLTMMRDSLVVVDTLIVAVDSLIIVQDSIQNGGSLDAEKTALEFFIDGLTDLRAIKSETDLADCLDDLENEVTDQVALLETGSTAIAVLDLITTGLSLTALDSSENHLLPMVLTREEAEYGVVIDGQYFGLTFTYTLVDSFDEDRLLIRDALLSSVTSNFDSLFCFCVGDTVTSAQVNCLASETSIHAYF